MSVDVIIRATTLKELMAVIKAINYADIPYDVDIKMAICEDIETAIEGILNWDVDIDKTVLSLPEVADLVNHLWDEIFRYGFNLSGVKILDMHGSLLISLENTKQ